MFRRSKEKQSLINASRKSLAEAESKIQNRNILISDLQKENTALREENNGLRFENEEQRELIDRIRKLANSNKYNNEKAVLNKIKELISDHESEN